MDYCKIADIVGIVLSCKNVEQSSVLLDPFEHARAYDELGYAMLTCMRTQGLPTVVGILQDLELIQTGKQAAVLFEYIEMILSLFIGQEDFQ